MDPTAHHPIAEDVPGKRIALIALAVLTGAAGNAAYRATPPDVRILFTGDILLSREVRVERQRTGQSPWVSLAPLLAHADWVAGNLEGAMGHSSDCAAIPANLCFALDDDAPALLAAAGFDAVSVENNHAGDLHVTGRASTIRALAHRGVLGVDFVRSPQFVRIGDLTVAMIAITMIPGSDGRMQTIPSVPVAQRLRLARSLANIVVVSVHWGTELHDWPSASQRTAAAWLVDHGADVVMGHHPHVVQQPECVHGRPVFFSLGNHVFDQKYPRTKEGLIADCVVHDGRMHCGGIHTHTRRGSAIPVASSASADGALSACSVPVSASLTMSGWTLRPAPWSPASADSDGVVIEGWRDGAIAWRSRRVQLVTLSESLASATQRPLLLALERHPSRMDGEVGLRPHVYEVGSQGLVARWRGTALAWPLLDAVVDADGGLCALHRGDSFLRIDSSVTTTRTMRYRWNGFGFSAIPDAGGRCARTFATGG